MQPGLGTTATKILMDRLATQAPNAHPKVINSIRIRTARAQAIHAFSCLFEPLLPQPIASASLSPSGTWQLLWRDGDTAGRSAHNACSIPKPRAIYLLGGAGEEGLGQVLRGRGGYGSGLEDEVKHQYPPQSHFAVWYSLSSAPTHVLFV